MARTVRFWMTSHPALAIAAVIGAAALVFLGILGIAQATERPAFCTSCHEMGPYYEAWQAGPHDGVTCVQCHVDSGLAERVGHKFVALQEVWVHATGDPTFPLAENEAVPDRRCLGCHADVKDSLYDDFSHADHAAKGPCIDCHSDVGHKVSAEALERAGVLDPKALARARAEQIAAVGEGAANLAGHADTTCQSCHDMAATGCAACHKPGHDPRTVTCTSCHSPGPAWVFSHPSLDTCADCHEQPKDHVKTATTVECATCHAKRGVDWSFAHTATADCDSCHVRPAGHRGGTCESCHRNPGADWAYSHPAPGSTCSTCHARPAKHSSAACQTCHKGAGRSWAFSHPGATANCANCHARPAGHSAQTCTNCHKSGGRSWAYSHPGAGSACASCHARPAKHSAQTCANCHKSPGVSWAFSHPGATATCTSCHARPAGHSSAVCTSCHATGTTWAFQHPTSTSCASCHSAPTNHYGTTCSSCHTPTKTWSSATFTHPTVPGGKHTYRSFSCASCHPSGYTSVNCISCHDAEDDDDD